MHSQYIRYYRAIKYPRRNRGTLFTSSSSIRQNLRALFLYYIRKKCSIRDIKTGLTRCAFILDPWAILKKSSFSVYRNNISRLRLNWCLFHKSSLAIFLRLYYYIYLYNLYSRINKLKVVLFDGQSAVIILQPFDNENIIFIASLLMGYFTFMAVAAYSCLCTNMLTAKRL
jgi:hypothetical protein